MENLAPIPQKRSRILEPYPLNIYVEYAAYLQPSDVDLLIRKRRRITAAIIIQYHGRKWLKKRDIVRQIHFNILRRNFLQRWHDRTVGSRLRTQAYRAAERLVIDFMHTFITQGALRFARLKREREEHLRRKNAISTIMRAVTTYFVLDMLTQSLQDSRAAAEARRIALETEETMARPEAERVAILEEARMKGQSKLRQVAEDDLRVVDSTAVIFSDDEEVTEIIADSLTLSPFQDDQTLIQSPARVNFESVELSLPTPAEAAMEVEDEATAVIAVDDEYETSLPLVIPTDLPAGPPLERAAVPSHEAGFPSVIEARTSSRISSTAAIVEVDKASILPDIPKTIRGDSPVRQATASVNPQAELVPAAKPRTTQESQINRKAKALAGKVTGFFTRDGSAESAPQAAETRKTSGFAKIRNSAVSSIKRAKAALDSSEDEGPSIAPHWEPETPSDSGSAISFLKNLVSRRASNASSYAAGPGVTVDTEATLVIESESSVASTPSKLVGMMSSVASHLRDGLKNITKSNTDKPAVADDIGPRSRRIRARVARAATSSEDERDTQREQEVIVPKDAVLSSDGTLAGRRILFHMRCFVLKRRTARLKSQILLYLVLRLQAAFRGRRVRKRFHEELAKHRQMEKIRIEVQDYHKTHDMIVQSAKKRRTPKPVKHATVVERSASSEETLAAQAQLVEHTDHTEPTPPESPDPQVIETAPTPPAGTAGKRRRQRSQSRQSTIGTGASEPLHIEDFGEGGTQSANILKSIARGFIVQERLIRLHKLSLISNVADATAAAIDAVPRSTDSMDDKSDKVEIEPMELFFPQDVRGVLSSGVVVDEASPLVGEYLSETQPKDWMVKEVSEVEVFELQYHQLDRSASRIQRAFRRFMTKRKFLAYLNEKEVETTRLEEREATGADSSEAQASAVGAPVAIAAGTDAVNVEACVVM